MNGRKGLFILSRAQVLLLALLIESTMFRLCNIRLILVQVSYVNLRHYFLPCVRLVNLFLKGSRFFTKGIDGRIVHNLKIVLNRMNFNGKKQLRCIIVLHYNFIGKLAVSFKS